jgi:enamine deaminase RidA (YjgF/YER057c/UK114 family)
LEQRTHVAATIRARQSRVTERLSRIIRASSLQEKKMLKFHVPGSVAAPGGAYSHGVEVPPNARWLFVAGQIPVRPDGSTPATIEEQTEVVWQNILAVLADAGMAIGDVVKITSYLTRYENFSRFAQIRAKFLGSHRPASTSVIISSLAKPDFLVEVEAIAAKPPAGKPISRQPKKAKRRSRR